MDQVSGSKLISLITQFIPQIHPTNFNDIYSSHGADLISIIRSMDLDLQPKPESKFMSLITQAVYVFNSMDLDSQPEPFSKLLHLSMKNLEATQNKIYQLFDETMSLDLELEFVSLIHQILLVVISMNPKWNKLIPVCVRGGVKSYSHKVNNKWHCFPVNWVKISLTGDKYGTHYYREGCDGENHINDKSPPVDIKHPLHPKHSLQLSITDSEERNNCYCCGEARQKLFYHCLICSLSISFSCSEKLLDVSIHSKWHEHILILFPSQDSVNCTVCAVKHSSCPFYICPPCYFLVHQSCLDLPRVIRISRHHHRISFTASFDQGDWFCGICRRKIHNGYGGYSCIKKGCFYAAHSKCATQTNVWDGEELEGKQEGIEEVVELFKIISYGIIQHVSHPDHHLRLDENIERDYDENKQCQACITPIYSGNFYSCIQCDFMKHVRIYLSRYITRSTHINSLNLKEITVLIMGCANTV